MNQWIQKNRKWFAYALYGVLITLGLLYFLFPSEALRDYLQAKADSTNSPLHLSIGSISPSLTFGLKFRKTELSRRADPDKVLFRADRLLLRPTLWSFLRGKWRFCFNGETYGGVLKGCVQFNKNGLEAPFATSVSLKEIRIGEYDNLSTLIGRHIEGSLGGTMTYNGTNKSLIAGAGEANLRLSEGRVELLQPILSLDSIDFDQVLIKMILKDQKINVTHAELNGPNIRGTLSGTVSLRRDFLKSTLDLRGSINPFADRLESSTDTLEGGTLPFTVRGTLTKPKFGWS